MHYLEKWEKGESDFLKKYKVKVRFIGDLERLPPQLVNLMAKVMQKTAKYQRRVLNVLVAYGGRFELLQAAKRIAKKALETGKVEVTEKELEKFLFVPTPVDLLIRTGGEQRISNFMPYQIAYSEIIFVEKFWPAFCKRDFLACIKEYTRRERRFGL
jgi:undecaprenyl diphosphate synthase